MPSRINIGPENGPYVGINESSGNLQLEDNGGNVVAEWDETNAQWDFANNTLNNVDALNSNSVNTEVSDTDQLRNRDVLNTRRDPLQYYHAKGQPLDGHGIGMFEDISQWDEGNADTSLSADSDIYFRGSQSAKIEMSGANEGDIEVDYGEETRDFSDLDFSIAIRYDSDSSNPDDVEIQFFDEASELVRFRHTSVARWPDDEWHRVDLGARLDSAPVDFSNIERVRIRLPGLEDGDVVRLDYLGQVPKPHDTGFVIFHVDNGSETDIDVHAPIFNEFGVSAHFAPIPDSTGEGSRLTHDELKQLQEWGHEIGHKNYSNEEMDTLSREEVRDEIVQAQEWAGENGYLNGRAVLTPRGNQVTPDVIEIAEETHEVVTTGYGNPRNSLRGQITANGMLLSRGQVDDEDLSGVEDALDMAERYNQVFHAYFHGDSLTGDGLRDYLEAVEERDVTPISLTQWVEMQNAVF